MVAPPENPGTADVPAEPLAGEPVAAAQVAPPATNAADPAPPETSVAAPAVAADSAAPPPLVAEAPVNAVVVAPPPAVKPAPAATKDDGLTVEWMLHMLREHGPITVMVALAAIVRGFRLREAPGSLIGDEVWYVQAARVIAGFPVLLHHLAANAKTGLDPNQEHPALGKLVIAGFLKVMGNNELAWRLPSVILGTFSIWLMYAIVLALKGTKKEALFAAFVLTFDNLFLIHGRIATLDVYLVTSIMFGTWLYLRGYLELAGIAFAVGCMCKTNAILGVVSVLLYEMMMARSQWRRPSWRAIGKRAIFLGFFVSFFLLGLGAMDCFVSEFRGPFEHLAHMAKFHASLKHEGPSTGSESMPFQWWLNDGYFDYYFLKSTNNGVTKHILFRSSMNNYVIFVAPLALLYASQQAWKVSSRLATFAIASFLGNFVPIFLAWAVMSRTSYNYYMLPSMPAFACAIALGAYAAPKLMRWGFVVLVLYAFVFMYPIRFFG